MKILCVIVLYKTALYDSLSYKTCVCSHLSDKDIGVFVYDNSPISMHAPNNFIGTGIEYCSDTNNSGISKAYNTASLYAKNNGYEWMLFLDQDTDFGYDDYINKCINSIKRNPEANIFVPIVKVSNEYFSPLEQTFLERKKFNYTINDFNKLEKSNIINSGILIRLETFLTVGGYNPRIPLDLADHQFIYKLSKVCSSFFLLNYTIIQSFSNVIDSSDSLKSRFRFYCLGSFNFEGCYLKKIEIYSALVKRLLSLSFRTKSFEFIKIFTYQLYLHAKQRSVN